jgi:hypothetical protein
MPAIEPAAPPLPADLVAAIVRPAAQTAGADGAPRQARVARSLRAALLAGLCVGFFSAALNIAAPPASGEELAPLVGQALGQSALPLPALSLVFGLWSGASSSMMSLLVTHRILNAFGWTRYAAYALGGGAVALAYAAAVHAMGLPHQSFGVEFLTGLGAGFFYRLFAGTVAADEA